MTNITRARLISAEPKLETISECGESEDRGDQSPITKKNSFTNVELVELSDLKALASLINLTRFELLKVTRHADYVAKCCDNNEKNIQKIVKNNVRILLNLF
ncbi:Hypothetical_protein [Hexamita inflata]|uniref:Hypothetical_protein n=1 Tax=Hexamita inflata TaxID=28002 RepID=A0AA86PWL2_9EUKA|nr:Hypothetical protein HINF_LOCUS33117 [Hexamita inflata]